MRNRLDTLSPDSLIKLGIKANIRGTHSLLGKFDDRLNSPRSTLLERTTVYALMKVNCLLIGGNVLKGRASLATSL